MRARFAAPGASRVPAQPARQSAWRHAHACHFADVRHPLATTVAKILVLIRVDQSGDTLSLFDFRLDSSTRQFISALPIGRARN